MHEPRENSWRYDKIAAAPLARRMEDHLLAAVRKLTTELSVEGVCDAILIGAEAVFDATTSWILLHDPSRDVLRTSMVRGVQAAAFRDAEIAVRTSTISGLTFSERQITFVPDAGKESRWFDAERVHASGLKTMFLVPLIAGAEAIGVLGIDSPEFGPHNPPSELHIKRLELFAAQAAIGVANARRYEASQRDRERLRTLLRQRRELRERVTELREEVRNAYSFGPIIGHSEALRTVLQEVAQVVASDITVLLIGETGTGKELVARALHEGSPRASRSFVPVNCAALPENLVESEMFGHEKGAFTGAHARKAGRFELADGGTLFLDEIGDLPLSAQSKLLRVLQDGRVERVGGVNTVAVNVRIVAATNQDLAAKVSDKTFREDLYYRLNVFPIRVPPLRERPEDVALLARHFGAKCAARLGRRVTEIHDAALAKLTSYSWPGNIRELQNVVERAVILAGGRAISSDDIRLEERRLSATDSEERPVSSTIAATERAKGPPPTLADTERAAIVRALRLAQGRISGSGGAAALLGLKPTTLHAKMKKLRVLREHAFNSLEALLPLTVMIPQ